MNLNIVAVPKITKNAFKNFKFAKKDMTRFYEIKVLKRFRN